MIRVSCPHCQTKYRFDEAQLGGKSRVKAKCKKCNGKIDIDLTASSDADAPAMPDAPPATPNPGSSVDPTLGAGSSEPLSEPSPVDAPEAAGDDDSRGQDSTAKVTRLRSDEPATDQTITGQAIASEVQLPPDKKYSLAVLQGKASGQIFHIQRVRTILGRADSDVILDDPEASRQHAVIEILGSRVVVSDMKSTNGTFVDGEQIDKMELSNHSEFRIGEHVFMLIVTDRE